MREMDVQSGFNHSDLGEANRSEYASKALNLPEILSQSEFDILDRQTTAPTILGNVLEYLLLRWSPTPQQSH
jgi:hypothetical protein